MIRTSTQILFFCLLAVSFNLNAQTCSISYTDPNPTPGYGLSLPVDPLYGFTSTNGTIFNSFPKNKLTTITSPEYHYSSEQTTIYFRYSLNIAVAGSTTTLPEITVTYGEGLSFSCTAASEVTINNGTNDLFFSITPGTAFPSDTRFRISLTMDIEASDKAVSAISLATNAILSGEESVLPVKFKSVTAGRTTGGVEVKWNVDQEQDLKGYEIERSIDGRIFSSIGFVAAEAQSTYRFTDAMPVENAFYRIKSLDLDGKFLYSMTVNVKGSSAAIVLKAFPMPVIDQLLVQHEAAASNGLITVSSADGRMVQSVRVEKGNQQTEVNLSSARPGLYILRYSKESGEVATLKIIKQ